MFPRLYIPLLVLLSAFCSQSCVQGRATLLTKKYAPEKLREDAEILREVMLQMHPAIGIYQPRSYYERLFSDFSAGIKDSMTLRDFRLRMKLVADQLHCGHTEVLYPKKFYRQVARLKMNFSPFIFLPVKNRLYVLACLDKRQDTLLRKGTQVFALNNIEADSMLRYCRRFVTSDGFGISGKDHFVQLAFNSYFPALFGRPDTFSLTYAENRQKKQLHYQAICLRNLPSLPLGPKNDSLFHRFRQARISYRYLDAGNKTMVMKIQRFSHSGDARVYRKLFRKISKNHCENLVIDLRNNGGGSLTNAYRLLSYLIDTPQVQTLRTNIRNYPLRKYTSGNVAFKLTRLAYRIVGRKVTRHDTDYFMYTIRPVKKFHYAGKILVLMNGGSFSASCLVGSYLKNNPRATFIGEESGGTQEGCNAGVTPFYTLPNSGLRVRMPAFRVIHDVCPRPGGRGIMPDIAVEYGFREIVSRRDLEMEKVEELCKAK